MPRPMDAAGGGSSLRRVVKPQQRYMPTRQQVFDDRSRLLSKIQALYRDACGRLSVDHAASAGICCVGLLDPVSNIVANTILSVPVSPSSPSLATLDDWDLASRSLDGLVAFLLYFFPYLADWDAVRYLLLADADLLVAARLIVASRGMTAFCINSAASVETFQPALRLAAQVAGHPQPERLDMIGPHILTRIESRSMYGLISFLQSRYHDLSEHEIVQCLVASCRDMSLADPNLAAIEATAAPDDGYVDHQRRHRPCRTGAPGLYDTIIKAEQQSPCAGVQEAYEAAATAAWHPNPAAQAAFLTSCKAKLQESPAAMSLLLQDRERVLSPEDVRYLAGVLLAEKNPSPQAVRKRSTWPVCDGKMRSMAEQRRISRNVKATLNQNFLRDEESMYKIHVICGSNDSVCGPNYCSKKDNLSFAPCEYRYTHVNFLATEKTGSLSSPVLFFGEFDNKKAEGEPAIMCCKVDMPLPFAGNLLDLLHMFRKAALITNFIAIYV